MEALDYGAIEQVSDRPRLGLVLGAGGIRGCAHAGVISVLREAQVPIDLVVGASVGAIFGMALAGGHGNGPANRPRQRTGAARG